MLLVYILIVSSFGAIVILAAKTKEIKSGRQTFVGKLLSKGDPWATRVILRIQAFLHHQREKTFFLFLVHIPSKAETLSRRLRSRAHGHYHHVQRKIRDRRDLSGERVSPYMRSMFFKRDGDSRRV